MWNKITANTDNIVGECKKLKRQPKVTRFKIEYINWR